MRQVGNLVTYAPQNDANTTSSSIELAAFVLLVTRASGSLAVTLTLSTALDGHQLGADAVTYHSGTTDVRLRELDVDFHRHD